MQTKGGLKEFFKYISVSIAGMLGLSFYILADTYFIARGLGANGLTALNLALPVFTLVSGLGLMLGMGGSVKYTVLKSRGDEKGANKIFSLTLITAIAVSVVFLLCGALFSSQIAILLGADKSVLKMTKTYLGMILLFAPAFMLNNTFMCFVRNDKNPNLSMCAMLTGSISNIILDYVFIFPLKMGIFGAVFATCLAPVISIFVLSLHKICKKNTFRFCMPSIKLNALAGILSAGFPSFICEISSGIVMLVFNTIMLKLKGNTGVAAYGVISNLSVVVISVFTGIAQGIQPLTSRAYGKSNTRQSQFYLYMTLILSMAVSAVMYSFIFFNADFITYAFNSENNAVLKSIAPKGLKIYFTAIPFAGANIIMSIYFASVEKSIPSHVVSVMRGIAIIVPSAFLLSYLLDVTGVWLAFPVSELLTAAVCTVIFIIDINKQKIYNKQNGVN